jgi:geranylgeranylglycerol-phosphate geranylgeranyltransferase
MGILAYLKLIRPPLAVLGFLASVSLLNWSGRLFTTEGILVMMSIGLGNLGWTVMNEVVDVEVDKVNKPWKPLPSGQADIKKALIMSVVLVAVSVWILAILIQTTNDPIYMLGFLGHLLSSCYDLIDRGLIGNICMAGSYGTAALLSLYPKHLPFALAFSIITFSFNLAVQYQDLKAEKTKGRKVAPEQLGTFGTAVTSIALSAVSIAVIAAMYLDEAYTPLTLFIASSVLTIISSLSILLPLSEKVRDKIIENCNRRLARLTMILGFLCMLLT